MLATSMIDRIMSQNKYIPTSQKRAYKQFMSHQPAQASHDVQDQVLHEKPHQHHEEEAYQNQEDVQKDAEPSENDTSNTDHDTIKCTRSGRAYKAECVHSGKLWILCLIPMYQDKICTKKDAENEI